MFTNVENVDSDKKERNHKVFAIKISTGKRMQCRVFSVDSVHNYYTIEGEELLARAICHELGHLDGDLYIDHVEGSLMEVVNDEDEE